MTQEQKWQIAIQERGYLVLAWEAGRKPGDVGLKIQGREGNYKQPMAVLQKTDYEDHVSQRALFGERPGKLPDGMEWYRFTTD